MYVFVRHPDCPQAGLPEPLPQQRASGRRCSHAQNGSYQGTDVLLEDDPMTCGGFADA
jgi:hypothetical protein